MESIKVELATINAAKMTLKEQQPSETVPSSSNQVKRLSSQILMASPTPKQIAQTVVRKSFNQVQLDDFPLETVGTKDGGRNFDDINISTAEFRGDQPGEFIRQMEAD